MSGYILYTNGVINNRLKVEDFGNSLYFAITEDWESGSKFMDLESVEELRNTLTKWLDDPARKEVIKN